MCLVVELAEKGKLVHAKQKAALAFERLPKLELQIGLFLRVSHACQGESDLWVILVTEEKTEIHLLVASELSKSQEEVSELTYFPCKHCLKWETNGKQLLS